MPRAAKIVHEELLTKPLFPLRPKSEWPRPDNNPYKKGRRPETEFFKYLKNKRVILVGPAGYLRGSGRGSEIDAYDVIVRMNLASPVAEELKPDIGSRTDVLYHLIKRKYLVEMSGGAIEPHTPKEIQSWKDDGVDWVVLKSNHDSSRVKEFSKIITDSIPWMTLTSYQTRVLRGRVDTSPNMGTIAVWHLLQSNIKSLYVTGCDFHATGYYPGYGGFNEEQAAKGIRGEAGMKPCWGQTGNVAGWALLHFVPKQLDFLKQLKQRDRRFTCDEVLGVLLK